MVCALVDKQQKQTKEESEWSDPAIRVTNLINQ